MSKARLRDFPVLARFVAGMIGWMDQENAGVPVGEYVLEEATGGYSSAQWEERGISGTVFLKLSASAQDAPRFREGVLSNTGHGMFALTVGPDGAWVEIEMIFYTRRAPPFLPEILPRDGSGAGLDAARETLADASEAGFFDAAEFFRSIEERPLVSLPMED